MAQEYLADGVDRSRGLISAKGRDGARKIMGMVTILGDFFQQNNPSVLVEE